jgi:hypothetical protein
MIKKQPHETDAQFWQREVDLIIDTFETPGVTPGGPSIRLNCTREDLPFAFEIAGQLHYRGRILIPAAKPKQRKQRDIQSDFVGK